MKTNRLEAFSDGVFAIIITIMVLELKVPHDANPDINALRPLLPTFLTYVLSFIYLGIYWNNHHHLLHVCGQVSGGIMWANLHLLFWLSLFPFVTAWMGENHFQSIPSALYGGVLLMAALAYVVLQTLIVRLEGPDSTLARAIGSDLKGKLSAVLYLVAIALSLWSKPWVAACIYAGIALIWLVPDRRMEKAFDSSSRR